MSTSLRIALIVGSAGLAACLSTVAFGDDEPAYGPPKPSYPSPEAPTCIMHVITDCRLPDGHPDLTGLWVFGGTGDGQGSGADSVVFAGRGDNFIGFEADGGLFRESTVDSYDTAHPNLPQYRPEYWNTIIDDDYNGNQEDPAQFCMPPGLPRLGAPAQIIALKDLPLVLLFYSGSDTGDVVRQIWTDGRSHNPTTVAAETWDGDSVGHWEGDSLVIESVGFTDASWLHKNGYIHGFDMKVTERLTRYGNQLQWMATVDDPQYLLQPWALTPVLRILNGNPNAELVQTPPCEENDRQHETSHVRGG